MDTALNVSGGWKGWDWWACGLGHAVWAGSWRFNPKTEWRSTCGPRWPMLPGTNDQNSAGRRPRHGAEGLPSDIGGATGHGDRWRGWEWPRGGGTGGEAPSGRGG